MRTPISCLFSSLHKPSCLSTSLYSPDHLSGLCWTHSSVPMSCVLQNPALSAVLQCWTERKSRFSHPVGYTLADAAQDTVDLCCKGTLWAARVNSLRTGKALAISQQHPTSEHPPNSKTPRTSSQVGRWLVPSPAGHSLQSLSSATMFGADTCFTLSWHWCFHSESCSSSPVAKVIYLFWSCRSAGEEWVLPLLPEGTCLLPSLSLPPVLPSVWFLPVAYSLEHTAQAFVSAGSLHRHCGLCVLWFNSGRQLRRTKLLTHSPKEGLGR